MKQPGDDRGPLSDLGQPAQRADTGVYTRSNALVGSTLNAS